MPWNDLVLNLVVPNDVSYNYAEERRLFYVALTRTRNRVFIVTPERRPSDFIKELLVFMTNDRRGGELSIQKCDWCKDGYLIVKRGNSEYILGCTNYKPDRSGCGCLLNRAHYLVWKNNDFGRDDLSFTRPSYMVQRHLPPETAAPEMIPEMIPVGGVKPARERKKPQVHVVGHAVRTIEKDGFHVLTDSDGNILTDMELLARLRKLRVEIAAGNNMPAYRVFHNDVLALLATDKPVTREEFLGIKGVGERGYDRFGERFIREIREYVGD